METSLSNLVDNLKEGVHKVKCKDCDCFFEYESVKDNLINVYLVIKTIQKKIDEELKSDLGTYLSFLIMILINLFFY